MTTDHYEDVRGLTDYPILQELAGALWSGGDGRYGAAVLVGAGLSRGATLASADTPRPPLWPDLCEGFAQRLYPADPKAAPTDALRIAEEFRAYHGQAALNAYIRSQIHDTAWYPSANHTRLLELPWADVLTTNWDTLLERAASSITQVTYSPVRFVGDLAQCPSPRIVKLHGSVGTDDRFIVAEEDYRRYPETHAAFVNFARQVFIENSLCLLGFSGDDPNFLQWSGWVRDHLENAHRRMYLVGVLNLSGAKRRLLEERGVLPIDLTPLVKDLPRAEQHDRATERFLTFLKASRPTQPYEWEPQRPTSFLPQEEMNKAFAEPAVAASLLRRIAERWGEDRRAYPGWLVCPADRRDLAHLELDYAAAHLQRGDAHLPPSERARAAYEFAWRREVALVAQPELELARITNVLRLGDDNGLTQDERCFLAIVLLTCARESDDDTAFAEWEAFIRKHASGSSDELASLAFQRCLRWRDRLAFDQLEHELAFVEGTDPTWKLRKAFLLCEIARWEEATSLLLDAMREFRKREADARKSVWVKSRRTWAEWLARGAASTRRLLANEIAIVELDRYAIWKCDPWTEIERLARGVLEAQTKLYEAQATAFVPQFEAGSYRERETEDVEPHVNTSMAYTVRRFAETACIPVRLEYTSFFSQFAAAAALQKDEGSGPWLRRLLRATRSDDHALVNRYLGRVAVARLATAVAAELAAQYLAAVHYWFNRCRADRDRTREWGSSIDALRLHMAVLYRLTPRMSEEQAVECFRLAATVAKEKSARHHHLNGVLSRLVQHSLESVGVGKLAELVIEILEFPLATEVDASNFGNEWPRPTERLFLKGIVVQRPANDVRWAMRVRALLEHAGHGKPSRPDAMFKLTWLAEHGLLTVDEREQFTQSLWHGVPDSPGAVPVQTSLFAFVFAKLPAPAGIDPAQRVREYLYGNLKEAAADHQRVTEIVAAASGRNPILPDAVVARSLLDELLQNLDPLVPELPFGQPSRAAIRRSIAQAVGIAALPAIAPSVRTVRLASNLVSLSKQADLAPFVFGFAHLLGIGAEIDNAVSSRILRGLSRSTWREVDASAGSLTVWNRLHLKGLVPAVDPRLLNAVLQILRYQSTGLVQAVHTIRQLCSDGVPDAFRDAATSELADLVNGIDYDSVELMGRAAVTISKVRAQAALLCLDLLPTASGETAIALTRYLEIARDDALPEVRFAAKEHLDS